MVRAGAMPEISAVSTLVASTRAKRWASGAAAGVHQPGIHLMVDEPIDLQDAVSQVRAVGQDAQAELVHGAA